MALDFEIDRDGRRIVVAVRDERGRSATINISPRGGAALAASLNAVCSSDDDASTELSLNGELTTTPEKTP